MSDTLSALIGIAIVLLIVFIAWRMARQVRRQSNGTYVSEVPGSDDRAGMSATDRTLFQQHTTTRKTWEVSSSGSDGPA